MSKIEKAGNIKGNFRVAFGLVFKGSPRAKPFNGENFEVQVKDMNGFTPGFDTEAKDDWCPKLRYKPFSHKHLPFFA